jgi:hypothetical protein
MTRSDVVLRVAPLGIDCRAKNAAISSRAGVRTYFRNTIFLVNTSPSTSRR